MSEPITKQLRGLMNHTQLHGVPLVELGEFEFRLRCDEIDAIVDALEAENRRMAESLRNLMEQRDERMRAAESHEGWVRLPVDADGVPFHIGEVVDVLSPFGGYAAPAPIDTMELSRGASGYGWMVKLDAENRASISPSLLRHHHAPTVEDVLREFGRGWHEQMNGPETFDIADYVERYAAKLRLAGSDAE